MLNDQTSKVLVAFPSRLLAKADQVAREEHRSRSELVREAVRKYLDTAEEAKALREKWNNSSRRSLDGMVG